MRQIYEKTKSFIGKLIPQRYRHIVKILAAVVLIVAAGFILLNYKFLYLNVKYQLGSAFFQKKTPIDVSVTRGEPNVLEIPSLGITAPIIYVDQINEPTFQEALIDGVVHYPGTANPGEFGNVYIFGHSSDFAFSKGKYKTVFALLPQIEQGAEIKVSGPDGTIFTYVVTDQFVANKDDVHLLEQGGRTQKQLTLQTSYPLGTALKRYIVIALLKE